MYSVNRSWLYGAVKPYFERKGIKLLKDDMLFIENCLSKVPNERHKKLISDYFQIWNASIAPKDCVEPVMVSSRFEANSFLRNVSGEAFVETEGKPPLISD
jgi:hypothetical protein